MSRKAKYLILTFEPVRRPDGATVGAVRLRANPKNHADAFYEARTDMSDEWFGRFECYADAVAEVTRRVAPPPPTVVS
jgi:hypothetical protein